MDRMKRVGGRGGNVHGDAPEKMYGRGNNAKWTEETRAHLTALFILLMNERT